MHFTTTNFTGGSPAQFGVDLIRLAALPQDTFPRGEAVDIRRSRRSTDEVPGASRDSSFVATSVFSVSPQFSAGCRRMAFVVTSAFSQSGKTTRRLRPLKVFLLCNPFSLIPLSTTLRCRKRRARFLGYSMPLRCRNGVLAYFNGSTVVNVMNLLLHPKAHTLILRAVWLIAVLVYSKAKISNKVHLGSVR